MPHASQRTTSGTILTEIFFGVSKECVRSWPHAFFITNLKTLVKKLLAVLPEKVFRRKKRKTGMTIAKLFALHANAKNKRLRTNASFRNRAVSVCYTSVAF